MVNVGAQLPLYQCHKTVRAAKITGIQESDAVQGMMRLVFSELSATKLVSMAWFEKHGPLVGGYYVVYEDGYESFSPAAAFEGGYTRI